MTDNEIIKSLEYCTQQGITSECERCGVKKGCRSELIVNALELISRQRAEIERLSNFVTEERCYEIAREMIPQFVKQAKFEAYKEVWKKLRIMCDAPHWCVWLSEIDIFFEALVGEDNDIQRTS